MDAVLNYYEKEYTDLAQRVDLQSNEMGILDDFHLFVLTVIHRTIQINKGFILLMMSKNLESAIPMLRILMDSLLAVRGCELSDNPLLFCRELLKGKKLSGIKIKGKNMPLGDFAESFDTTEDAPGMKELYDFLCSFIHISNNHTKAMITANGSFCIDESDLSKDPDLIKDVIENYNDLNAILLNELAVVLEKYRQH